MQTANQVLFRAPKHRKRRPCDRLLRLHPMEVKATCTFILRRVAWLEPGGLFKRPPPLFVNSFTRRRASITRLLARNGEAAVLRGGRGCFLWPRAAATQRGAIRYTRSAGAVSKPGHCYSGRSYLRSARERPRMGTRERETFIRFYCWLATVSCRFATAKACLPKGPGGVQDTVGRKR